VAELLEGWFVLDHNATGPVRGNSRHDQAVHENIRFWLEGLPPKELCKIMKIYLETEIEKSNPDVPATQAPETA
jgi:hypothetical protein